MAKTVAVLDDPFFGAKISETARQLGCEVQLLRAAEFDPARLAAARPALVIVDLNATSADTLELVRELKRHPVLGTVPLIGFLSHVQADLRQAAEQAGCNEVMPRSKFSATLPELLRRYTAAA